MVTKLYLKEVSSNLQETMLSKSLRITEIIWQKFIRKIFQKEITVKEIVNKTIVKGFSQSMYRAVVMMNGI